MTIPGQTCLPQFVFDDPAAYEMMMGRWSALWWPILSWTELALPQGWLGWMMVAAMVPSPSPCSGGKDQRQWWVSIHPQNNWRLRASASRRWGFASSKATPRRCPCRTPAWMLRSWLWCYSSWLDPQQGISGELVRVTRPGGHDRRIPLGYGRWGFPFATYPRCRPRRWV